MVEAIEECWASEGYLWLVLCFKNDCQPIHQFAYDGLWILCRLWELVLRRLGEKLVYRGSQGDSFSQCFRLPEDLQV